MQIVASQQVTEIARMWSVLIQIANEGFILLSNPL